MSRAGLALDEGARLRPRAAGAVQGAARDRSRPAPSSRRSPQRRRSSNVCEACYARMSALIEAGRSPAEEHALFHVLLAEASQNSILTGVARDLWRLRGSGRCGRRSADASRTQRASHRAWHSGADCSRRCARATPPVRATPCRRISTASARSISVRGTGTPGGPRRRRNDNEEEQDQPVQARAARRDRRSPRSRCRRSAQTTVTMWTFLDPGTPGRARAGAQDDDRELRARQSRREDQGRAAGVDDARREIRARPQRAATRPTSAG